MECLYILLPDDFAFRCIRRQSSQTHGDDTAVQIGNIQRITPEIEYEPIGIGSNAVVLLVIETDLLNHIAFHVASRVQREPTPAHFRSAVLSTFPISDDMVGVVSINKDTITIEEVGTRALQFGCDVGDHVVVAKHVVGMDEADDIASSHANTFVDRLIHPMIWLRDIFDSDCFRRISDYFFYHLLTTIGRCTIHNDILDIMIILRQYAMYSIDNGGGTVVTCGDDGDFHTMKTLIVLRRYIFIMESLLNCAYPNLLCWIALIYSIRL